MSRIHRSWAGEPFPRTGGTPACVAIETGTSRAQWQARQRLLSPRHAQRLARYSHPGRDAGPRRHGLALDHRGDRRDVGGRRPRRLRRRHPARARSASRQRGGARPARRRGAGRSTPPRGRERRRGLRSCRHRCAGRREREVARGDRLCPVRSRRPRGPCSRSSSGASSRSCDAPPAPRKGWRGAAPFVRIKG